MKPLISFILTLAIIACPRQTLAQDIHFSQAFETPLLRNPSLAGLFNGDIRVQSVYRTQWNSVTVPYQTVSLNAEYKLPVGRGDDFLTLGAQVLYDKAGTVAMTTTHFLPALNYHKSLSADRNMYLSMGFIGGLVQRRIDMSKMTTNNQYDGTGLNSGISTGETMQPGYSYFDGAAGMSFNSQVGADPDNNMFVGFAYHHFNKPSKNSFYSDESIEMKPKWVASAGIRMALDDYTFLAVEADHTVQEAYSQTLGGVMYGIKLDSPDEPRYILYGGTYLRWKDAIIPVAKIEFRPVAVAVSYDINISGLSAGSRGRGGLELSLVYQKYLDRHNSSRDAVRCPRF